MRTGMQTAVQLRRDSFTPDGTADKRMANVKLRDDTQGPGASSEEEGAPGVRSGQAGACSGLATTWSGCPISPMLEVIRQLHTSRCPRGWIAEWTHSPRLGGGKLMYLVA